MIIKASEKGQALILIAMGAIALFSFAALAIDGSMAFSDKRHAQNAADASALAGASPKSGEILGTPRLTLQEPAQRVTAITTTP